MKWNTNRLPWVGTRWDTSDVVAPTFIPSGTPAAWYDASQLTGLSDGDPMATFPDSGAGGNTLVQGVEALRPTYQSDAGSLKNGLATVKMGILGDRFEKKAFTLAQPSTIFIVFRPITFTTAWFIMDGYNVNTILFGPKTTEPNYAIYAGLGYQCNIDVPTGSWHIAAVRMNGASSFIVIDGVSSGNGNPGAEAANGFTLGGTANGTPPPEYDFGEAIVYNGAEDLTANLSGLATKWGIT